MPRDDDPRPTPEELDPAESRPDVPWWAEHADEDAPLPDGYPERPDLARVHALRERLRQDAANRPNPHRTPLHDRVGRHRGRSVRAIGSYTLIPMMLLVGPALGWLVGHWLEGRVGGAPWLGVGGIVFGLAAAVQQIVQMLKKNAEDNESDTP